MKLLKILLVIAALYAQIIYAETKGHASHAHNQGITIGELSAGNIDADGEQVKVDVFGLVCDFCAQTVEKVFMKRQEVSGIKVNLSDGLIIVYTKKDQSLDDETLSKLIINSGYSVDSISRTAP